MKTFGTAAILSGGRSTRMGFDKQLLTINEQYIFENNIKQLKTEFDDILVITNTPELYEDVPDIRTYSDIYPGMGPLAGLHAALTKAESQYVYIVACDMPVMNMEFAAFLKKQTLCFTTDVCASNADGHFESFNAFYSVNILPALEDTLAECYHEGLHTPGIYGFITMNDISSTVIDEHTVRIIDPELSMFLNLNTPKEYNAYKRRVAQRANKAASGK